MNHLLRAAALGGLIFGLGAGCNTAAKINAPKIYFYNAQILGAVPVVKNGDAFERMCRTSDLAAGQKLDGLAVDLQFISTERKEQGQTVFDKDKSIQLGDDINRQIVDEGDLTVENVKMTIDCVKQASPALSRECEAGTDLMAPNSQIVKVGHVKFADRFEAWGGGEGVGVGVVVLVDQSGSVSGFVQPNPAVDPPDASKPDQHYEMDYNAANLAITKWQQEQADPGVLERLASDKKHFRQTALQSFISGLNKTDKLLVMSYNEELKNKLLCSAVELENPTMKDCFVTRRDWVTKGLNDLPGNEGGRTPLWEALYNAVEFLQAETELAAKHIVVLNDGPDTCNPNSEHFVGGAPCGDRDLSDVIGLLDGDTGELPVHVHFVQYQAKGYPSRDQAQAEVACLTDGTYTFVNRGDMGSTEFEEALRSGLDRARYAFLGKWRLMVESDVVSLDLPWPSGTPVGRAFAAYGNLKLLPNPFITAENIFTFKVGNQSNKEGVQETPNWDNSLGFRKDCSASSQCGGDDAAQCTARCGWEAGLCLAAEVSIPVGTACTQDGGAGGVCCLGTCQDPALPCE